MRAVQLAAIAEFKSMLRERKEITPKSRWLKVDIFCHDKIRKETWCVEIALGIFLLSCDLFSGERRLAE